MLSNKKKYSFVTKNSLILASNSTVRKKILKGTGLKFKTIPSDIDEKLIKNKYRTKSFSFVSKRLAEVKALNVSYKNNGAYVIGADQICVIGKKLLDKPLTKERAVKQLIMLAGNEHKQISGCSVCLNGKIIHTFQNTAKLTMRNLLKKEIIDYINYDMPLKSCGAYKFESKGYLLFSRVLGDQYTIQGLPIFLLINFLFKKKIIKYV